MKWGVRRANKKAAKSEKLYKKALKYDQKEAAYRLRAEKKHNRYDLAGLNRDGVRAAKLDKRALKIDAKANKLDNGVRKSKLERKAERLRYKSANIKRTSELISRSTGYGARSMRDLKRSTKYAARAEKARYEISKNNLYIEKMKRKINEIPKEDLDNGYEFCKSVLDIEITRRRAG